MKVKRSNQNRVPSINKHLFSFPSLTFFSTAVLYFLVFEFSMVIVNCVKELGPFCLACRRRRTLSRTSDANFDIAFVKNAPFVDCEKSTE